MISDVKEILNLSQPTTSTAGGLQAIIGTPKSTAKKHAPTQKKPEGMARELYALLTDQPDGVPPLMPCHAGERMAGYKAQRARLGMQKPRAWTRREFVNEARMDDLKLSHWTRADATEAAAGEVYPFAKFNRVIDLLEYTDAEYDAHLACETWSREETDHLLLLCKRFDLRWPVIYSRYDRSRYDRTVEDLKERFYDLQNALSAARSVASDESERAVLYFDATHERKRKEQLGKLYARTKEQIEEEEYLVAEMNKIEARRKEREKRTQELQRLIAAAENGGTMKAGAVSAGSASALAGDKKARKSVSSSNPKKSSAMALADAATLGENAAAAASVKWPELKGCGVSLRSVRLKTPGSLGQKRLKKVEELLEKFGVELLPIPTEEICNQFNALRSDLVLLSELKNALATCQYELETLRHQHSALTGNDLPIPEHLKPAPGEELPH